MASPVAETGRHFTLSHRSSSAFTGGITRTIDFNIVPAGVSIHTGVAHVQATNQGPCGAGAGVMAFKRVGEQPVALGFDPVNWVPQVYGRISSFTAAFNVVRGDMTGWVFFQVWG